MHSHRELPHARIYYTDEHVTRGDGISPRSWWLVLGSGSSSNRNSATKNSFLPWHRHPARLMEHGNLAHAQGGKPRTKNQPRTNQEPRTKNQEPRTKNQEPRTKNALLSFFTIRCLHLALR